VKIVKT